MGDTHRDTERDDTPLSQAIVEAVAEREGVDVTEVEPPAYQPLYTVVDPDALDAVFAPTVTGEERASGSIVLQYAGYRVTAHSDGEIELAEGAGTDEIVDSSTGR